MPKSITELRGAIQDEHNRRYIRQYNIKYENYRTVSDMFLCFRYRELADYKSKSISRHISNKAIDFCFFLTYPRFLNSLEALNLRNIELILDFFGKMDNVISNLHNRIQIPQYLTKQFWKDRLSYNRFNLYPLITNQGFYERNSR